MSETQTTAVTMHTGATVNGVQTQAEVLMQRHTPTSWPTAKEGLTQWTNIVNSLNVVDFEKPLASIAMHPRTGGLYDKTLNGVGQTQGIIPTRTALSHLMSYGEGPSYNVENLEFYPPSIRAQMVEHQLAKVTAAKPRTVVLRTAVRGIVGQNEERVIRAVTSDMHSRDKGDDLALIAQFQRLPSTVLANARMRVVKEWDYTHVEMVIPNKVREVRPGIVINGRINVKNSETKGGSFEASVGTMNLVCLNGMVGNGSNSTVSVKHVGDIRSRMGAGVRTVIELVDVYLEEFFQAYNMPLPKSQSEVIEATVKRFKLPEATGAALGALWNVDGERSAGHTVAGLANALTRHAQSLPVERALEVEAVAGKVVSMGLSAFL
jgi:hypothetical protein